MYVIKRLIVALGLCYAGLAAAAGTVNINTADAAALGKQLKGVGPSKAAAIVEYRGKHGPFKSVDQLTQVKGIGKKLIDMNRDVITVGAVTPTPGK